MANKKKPENGEDLIRQYLKDKAAGRSTFDEKSDFQKRVRSGENFGKPHDFGQSEKQKPSVPKTPITDNKRRDLQSTLNEQREEQQRAQRKAETDALASKKEERDSLKKEADNLPASKQIIIISFLKVFILVHKQVYSAVIYIIILSFFLKHFAYGNGNLSVIA